MLIKVVIRPVRYAPEFAPTEWEQIFEVRGSLAVKTEFLLVVVAQTQFFGIHIKAQQPLVAEILPVGKPFEVGAGLAEEFKFHLLEFPRTESKVAGSNLVTETLAYLTDSERYFEPGSALYVFEVNKNALRRLGP